MDLNSAKMHFWSKFGNPDYDPWWLMARTNSQAQTGIHFYFEVKFDLEGQGISTPKTIRILTVVFYTYGLNLVILAGRVISYRADKLGDGRTDGLTDGRTGRRRQRQYPKAKNGQQFNQYGYNADGENMCIRPENLMYDSNNSLW